MATGLRFLMVGVLLGIPWSSQAQSSETITNRHTACPYVVLQNSFVTNIPGAASVISSVLAAPSASLCIPDFTTTNASFGGTFWTISSAVPLPADFFPSLPVYVLDATNRIFLIDDRSVDYEAMQAMALTNEAAISLELRANAFVIDTNGLWLEVPTNALPAPNFFNVVIHNTAQGNYYDVLTKSDLLWPSWGVETNVAGAEGSLTPVTLLQNGRTNLFVWARQTSISVYTQPLSQEVYNGDTVTFSVDASGVGLTYQWMFNGTNIYGATGSSYTIDNAQDANIGDYTCLVTSASGSVTTQTATLTVTNVSHAISNIRVIGQRQDYTFKNGVTYYIGSTVQLYGNTTLEDGTIIKFDYTASYPTLQVLGTLTCKGTPYNPSILTTIDDDSFGQQWSYGAPQPNVTGVPYLDLTGANSLSITNIRFRYADEAVTTPAGGRLDVWNCQFFQCDAAIFTPYGGKNCLHNVLFAGCYDAVAAYTNSFSITAEHVTADVSNFSDSSITPDFIGLTNSIIIGSMGNASSYSSIHSSIAPAQANFQTSGAGLYYLAVSSTLHQSGTTNVSTSLLNGFRSKTTFAPMELPTQMSVSGSMTLFPIVSRYTNGAPDIGYYYDALDYTVAGLTSSGSITVEPGTAIGFREDIALNSFWGFDLRENSTFISHGTPDKPIVFADVQWVQEQYEYPCYAGFVPDFKSSTDQSGPTMDFRFCNFYPAEGWYHLWAGASSSGYMASYNSVMIWNMRDCKLRGGQIVVGEPDSAGLNGGSGIFGIPYTTFYGSGAISWNNNLFDNVQVNLQPTFNWVDGTINVDLSFHSKNNLFKQGGVLVIKPVAASTGNWTFADNLFDRVEFFQDATLPLDYNHNGYWPLNSLFYHSTTTQLQSTTTGDGTTDGTGEVVLGFAPPYRVGPFGNYYFSTITALYQSGSQTADSAGLAQYTTFINQAKDSANQQVNIGLHYVTATNSLAQDSDADGVPDYVEAEHGTDPNNSMTDGVTNDAYNVAYDDVDLSGNGLVGRIKKALGQSPFNASNPLTLKQVGWDADWGITSFEVPIGYNKMTNIGSVNIFVNGVCAPMEDVSSATNGNTLITWNTTYNSTGLHLLQPRITVRMPADDGATLSANGITMPYYSDNPVRFYENDALYNDSGAYLDAQVTSSTNQYYTIRIFNPSTIPATFMKGITNSTSNGMIQEDWDLTYDDGTTIYTGDTFDAEFTVSDSAFISSVAVPNTPNPNPPPQKKRTKRHTKIGSNEQGNGFNFAYMYTPPNSSMNWAFGDDVGAVWIGMQNVVDTLTMPVTVAGGHANHYDSLFNRYTSQRFPGDVGFPGYLNSQTVVNNRLFPSMTNGATKNFYVAAHGSGDSVGSYDLSVTIFAADIAGVLGNYYSGAKIIKANYPYRFVFMDGCSTASSREWRQAFGIFPLPSPTSPARSPLGPQAYVGWAYPHVGWVNSTEDSSLTENVAFASTTALDTMYELWMNGQPLSTCIDAASTPQANMAAFPVPANKTLRIHGWPGVDGEGYDITMTNVMTSPIYIIGHSGLTKDSFRGEFDNATKYNSPVDAP